MVDQAPAARAPRARKKKTEPEVAAAPPKAALTPKEALRNKLGLEFTARFKDSQTRTGLEKEAENKICNRLGTALAEEFGIWAAYRAHGFEPNLERAIRLLQQVRWAFPRVEGGRLDFYIPNSPENFVVSSMGILEPDPSRSTPVNVLDIDGLIIPGVAFDTNCYRLGRGGGYYDRLLSMYDESGHAPLCLGVGFDDQLLEQSLPLETHDRKLDGVLTERRALGRFFEDIFPER